MEATLKKVLLATDGSEDAALAATAAVHLLKKMGAKLYIAHAWRLLTQQAGYPAVFWTDYAHLYEREARKLLASQTDAVEGLGCAVEEARLLKGPPIDAILDLCDELDPGLVVVGSRGLGSLRRILLGSVSEGIVHHARCPVLVVRGGEAWPPKRIIVGDDGSEDSGRAAKLAASIGGVYGADVVLVRAHQNPPEPIGGWSATDRRKLEDALLREEESVNKRVEKFGGILESRPKVRIVRDEPAAALMEVAAEEDGRNTLLAVGSRGLGALLSRARLGSVSTKVLRAADGPVLICPQSVA